MIMNVLNTQRVQALLWVQALTGERDYVLRTKEEVVATLRWERHLRSRAIAEAFDGSWVFTRKGVFRPHIVVHTLEERDEVAVLTYSLNKSVLQFRNGHTFVWHSSGQQLSHWTWQTERGESLIEVKIVQVQGGSEARVLIEEHAQVLPELSLLLLSGWYLVNS